MTGQATEAPSPLWHSRLGADHRSAIGGSRASRPSARRDMASTLPARHRPRCYGRAHSRRGGAPGAIPSTILIGSGLRRVVEERRIEVRPGSTPSPTSRSSTFGDIAISRSDPSVVYAGTGEQQNRQSSSYGNGVYRSDDGGEHLDGTSVWKRHVIPGRVLVHPTNPDVVYVGAVGNLWAPVRRAAASSAARTAATPGSTCSSWTNQHGVIDMAMDLSRTRTCCTPPHTSGRAPPGGSTVAVRDPASTRSSDGGDHLGPRSAADCPRVTWAASGSRSSESNRERGDGAGRDRRPGRHAGASTARRTRALPGSASIVRTSARCTTRTSSSTRWTTPWCIPLPHAPT